MVSGDKTDKEDTELMSTALGCIQAINKILFYSMEGDAAQNMFPQMESVLE